MMGMLGGVSIRILESPAACTYRRARTYPKRRAKSKRHWARMDKKYAKRYGTIMEPQAYAMGDTIVVHPLLAPSYRAAINNAFKPADPRENRL